MLSCLVTRELLSLRALLPLRSFSRWHQARAAWGSRPPQVRAARRRPLVCPLGLRLQGEHPGALTPCAPRRAPVALAHYLGLRVGILDADVHGPSIPRLLNLRGRPDVDEGAPRWRL